MEKSKAIVLGLVFGAIVGIIIGFMYGGASRTVSLGPEHLIGGGCIGAIIGALVGAALGAKGNTVVTQSRPMASGAMTPSASSESTARYCAQCGQALVDGALFCGSCGARKA